MRKVVTIESSRGMPVGWQILLLDNHIIYSGRTDSDIEHIDFDTIVMNPIDVARVKASPTGGTA